MSDYITTYSGKHFYPTAPSIDAICIEDIARSLPLICRGNGHVKSYWSVGQHCICCAKEAEARGLSDRIALAALLHDASECYMSDIPRPFKKELPEYIRWENNLLKLIYEKYLGSPLTGEEEGELKEMDDSLLWYDLKNLLGEELPGKEAELHIKIDYTFRPFEEVEEEYLGLFYRHHKNIWG